MKNVILPFLFVFSCSLLAFPFELQAQVGNEAVEPSVVGDGVIDLLQGEGLGAWDISSEHWLREGDRIIGDTKGEVLHLPDWLYTKERFGDFEFTCELLLTGDTRRNTGIYYRVNKIQFERKKSYEAPSGYEFDAAYHNPGKRNNRGSLGDWYARPKLRIMPDQAIINEVYREGDWNRMTLRARGNRLEYWINGFKIMDFTDEDPNGSREGVIGFQIHDGSVMRMEWRNIRVLPLDSADE